MRVRFEKDMETKLPICTVGYPLHGDRVLLGKKAPTEKAVKRKINGYWLGFGGDFETEDVTLKKSFARELFDETGFSITPEEVGIFAKILIKDEKGDRLMLYYAIAHCEQGLPKQNREFDEFSWFPKKSLPEKILGADRLILHRIFAGEKLEGWVQYDKDMNVVNHHLETIETVDEALP
jgi:8-oxo-dGTP pyrophosphatase MutT (NUDIX family)